MKIAKYNISKDENKSGDNSAPIYGTNATAGNVTVSSDAASSLKETHLIWGQPFNGTQDVAGDITNAQNITNQGDITVNAYTDDAGEHGGNITADKTITANKFVGVDVEASNNITAKSINASTGTISVLSGSSINFSSAEINHLLSNDIKAGNLTVTGTAHFFELIIDKIKSVGGAVILSPADGFKVEKVTVLENVGYWLWWKAEDGQTAIGNMWLPGDQALCMSFNQSRLGKANDVNNKYYWCLVIDKIIKVMDNQPYHGILIRTGAGYSDGTVNPEVGDEIVMLGSQDNSRPDRQSAIYISAYNGLDTTLQAPFICQYTGINDFNLSSHKYTWFAHNSNEIRGNFKVSNGKTLEQFVTENLVENPYKLVPVREKVELETSYMDLIVDLSYLVYKGDGTTPIDCGSTKDVYLAIVDTFNDSEELFTTGTQPSYYNDTYVQQYGNNQGGEPEQLYVELRDSDTDQVLLRRIVNLSFSMYAALQITDKISASVRKVTSNLNTTNTKVAELELTADGLTSKVESMGGWEYDMYDVSNWTFNKLITTKATGTDFNNCFYVPTVEGTSRFQSIISFLYPMKFTDTTYVSVLDNYSITVLYFDSSKKYLGEHRTYSKGEHQIENIANAYYIGISLNATSDGMFPANINSIISALKSSHFSIFDTKIASSLIKQTADLILLKVDEVSLKIDNSKVVIDGDTEINGSLTLDNTEQGFILKGNGGETNISPDTIGTYSSFSALSSVTLTISRTIKSAMNCPPTIENEDAATRHYLLNYETEENLGYLKSGDYIQFTDLSLSYSANDGKAMLSGLKTYTLMYENTTVKTFNTTSNSISGEVFNFTTTTAGNYKLKVSINFNCDREKPTTSSSTGLIDAWTWSVFFTANYSIKLVKPTADAHMLIGYDGIAANFGNNKTVYIGKNESTFRYGIYGLRISNNGIQLLDPNNHTQWTNIGTKLIQPITSNTTVADIADMCVKNVTGTYNVTLPTSSVKGRTVYFKNTAQGSLVIVNPNNRLIAANSSSQTTSITLGNNACFFIFDGTYWLQFYCG